MNATATPPAVNQFASLLRVAGAVAKREVNTPRKVDRKVSKNDCGHALTAIRKPLAEAWKQVSADSIDGYVSQVKLALDACDAALKLAEQYRQDHS